MKKNKIQKNKAFTMLFAVILSSIILAIALGVSDVAVKEITFGTSAIDTNNAFFAADTGAECVLYNDKTTTNKFPLAGPATAILCGNTSITPSFTGTGTSASYSFVMAGLGSTGRSCVKVSIVKNNSTPPMKTTVVAKGYNIGDASCDSTNPNRVERELHVDY